MSYQKVGVSGFTSSNKIPVYAREYKREYQFIRGINKDFKYLLNKINNRLNNGLNEFKLIDRIKFNLKRFLRGQEKGTLKDISDFVLPFDEVDNIININNHFEFRSLRWNDFFDNTKPHPGLVEIYDIFKFFCNQIKYDDEPIIDFHLTLIDSDSDSDSDSEDYCYI